MPAYCVSRVIFVIDIASVAGDSRILLVP